LLLLLLFVYLSTCLLAFFPSCLAFCFLVSHGQQNGV
jgi:hypothetical protein